MLKKVLSGLRLSHGDTHMDACVYLLYTGMYEYLMYEKEYQHQ